MDFLTEHAGEMIVGLVLGMFGLSFRSWAQALIHWKATVEKSTDRVLNTIESLSNDYRSHKLESERRLTRMEAKVEEIEHLCNRNHSKIDHALGRGDFTD